MPKVILKEYDDYPFKTELSVRVSDLNYGAHLGHDHLLGLVHEARLSFFSSLGLSEGDIGDGVGLVVGDLAVVYQGEAFHGDVLTIELRPIEVSRGSFRFAHRLKRSDGTKVALVEIGFVAFGFEKRKAMRVPTSFVEKLDLLHER